MLILWTITFLLSDFSINQAFQATFDISTPWYGIPLTWRFHGAMRTAAPTAIHCIAVLLTLISHHLCIINCVLIVRGRGWYELLQNIFLVFFTPFSFSRSNEIYIEFKWNSVYDPLLQLFGNLSWNHIQLKLQILPWMIWATQAFLTLSHFHVLWVPSKQWGGGIDVRHKSQLQWLSQVHAPIRSL